MTPEQLKASILQYAIQGKLVEQRPEEGTAEELYQQIQAEKQRLVKEGKIKKEKTFSQNPAYQDYPFDIPDTWKFVRFGELLITRDSERVPVSVSDRNKRAKIYDYYGASGIIDKIDDYLFDDELLLIGEDGANLLSRSTPIAFIAKGKYWVNNHAHVLDACCNLNLNYICYHINAISLAPYVTGTAQPKMNQENMNAIWIALPPLEEQYRIVAKIEGILPLVDRYAAAYEKLEQFNAKFPEDMKKSILQYAIQGKLVEQRPEEGTGEELYQQIQAEKQRLIKDGKIKKEKPLPEITEDEIPFDIPGNWKWVRLSNIAESIVDCPHSTPKYLDMETEYCTIDTNCIDEKGDITKWRYVDADTYTARITRLTPQKDDIVYTREGSICRAAILPEGSKVCLGQRVMLIRSANGVFPQFIRRLLMSPMVIRKLTEQQKGIGAKHVNVSDVCNLILPLPPLTEQMRIVAKLEEILPLCERLK